MPLGRRRTKKQVGRGARWKTWLPRSIIRTTFEHLSTNLRSVGRLTSSSHATVRAARGAVAEILHNAQASRIQQYAVEKSPWLILSIMFDETKFRVALKGDVASKSSIFLAHGFLRRGGQSDNTQLDEIVMPPLVLKDCTASGLLAGLRATFPSDLPIEETLKIADRSCLQLTTDAAATNYLVVKHLASKLPPHSCLLYQRCFQHQAGLALSFATLHLGFLTKMFCTAKTWQDGAHLRGLRMAIKRIIAENLVRDETTPPSREDQDRLETLLQHCFLVRSSRQPSTPEEDKEHRVREQEADKLRAAFNGDIRDRRAIRHHCQGCCSSHAEAVDRCFTAYCTLLRQDTRFGFGEV